MRTTKLPLLALVASLGTLAGCVAGPIYPSRPSLEPGPPMVELEPAKVTMHISATTEGLSALLDTALPATGEGALDEAGKRKYFFERGPIEFRIEDEKLVAEAELEIGLELPFIGRQSVAFALTLKGRPVITSDYKVRMQDAEIDIAAADMKMRAANLFLGVLAVVKTEMKKQLDDFAYDLAPMVQEGYAKLAEPIPLPLGDASGCVALKLSGIEAAPTVLAGGFEKDIAITVSPSVTIPCAPPPIPKAPPPLANVVALPTGAFKITIPIAARYDELQKAMTLAFTDGRLYPAPDDAPELYIDQPEVFSSEGKLVLKVHLGGEAKGVGLDGDIYFGGSPTIVDNHLTVPDIEPTVDTNSFLLGLVAALGRDMIRDKVRKALRLDIGARLVAVREKLSADTLFGDETGCVRTDVSNIKIRDVFAHGDYLRIYVEVTAQAGVWMPCPGHVRLPACEPGQDPYVEPAPDPVEGEEGAGDGTPADGEAAPEPEAAPESEVTRAGDAPAVGEAAVDAEGKEDAKEEDRPMYCRPPKEDPAAPEGEGAEGEPPVEAEGDDR